MIISHQHKYLFIEIPHTASTAISRELCENYDGVPILRKHAHYPEFLRIASGRERNHFVFASVRNPLDEAVSLYFKYKTNHKGRFTNPRKVFAKEKRNVTNSNIEIFKYVQETNADFPDFFRKIHKFPYNNVISLSYKYCNFIIRFERLQEDFLKALQLIGIEQKRSLPHINKTAEKQDHFVSYYTPEIIEPAKKVFGPFMKRWGYDFPAEWGDASISWLNQLEFLAVDMARNFYWKHLRWSPHFYGRLIRRFN